MPRKKSTTSTSSRATSRTTQRKQGTKSSKAAKATSVKEKSVDSGVVDATITTKRESKERLSSDVDDSPTDQKAGSTTAVESPILSDESTETALAPAVPVPEIDDGQQEAEEQNDAVLDADLDADTAIDDRKLEQAEIDASEAKSNNKARQQDNTVIQADASVIHPENPDEEETSRAVEVVVDRRSPEPENPQPIHPMDAMTAQLSEPMAAPLNVGDLASSDIETVTVEAIDTTVETITDEEPEELVLEDNSGGRKAGVDAVEVDSEGPSRTLSGPMVDELNLAIATAHRHEEELESQLAAIQEHEDQLKQRVVDAKRDSKRFAKKLAKADLREQSLKQDIADLKEELIQANTQVMQAQSQLNDQDKNQREIDKLKGEVTTLKSELDEAKRYILQLTDQLTEAQALAQRSSPSQRQPQNQSSTTFPPPLTQRPPHTRVVGSPRTQPRRPAPRPVTPLPPAASGGQKPSGLPPMSTERFGGSAPITPSQPSRSLRKAYTRPGFSKPPASLDQASTTPTSQPMPPLESISRNGASSASAPPNSGPSNSAIVPQKSSPIAQRRSRYDDLKPDLKSSNLPQPKVSDAEIGWFD